MKYILAFLILTLTSSAFALHSPSDTVFVTIRADGSTGCAPNASFGTARSSAGVAARCSFTTASDTGSAVGKVGASFLMYRTYLVGPNMESGYPDSFTVAAGNTVNVDQIFFRIRATNAEYLGGCTGNIKCFMQNPLAANATSSNVSVAAPSTFFNDWLTIGTWIPFDSVTVDTTVFGLSDTTWLTFRSSTATITNIVEGVLAGNGVAAEPMFHFVLTACFDADSVAPSNANDTYAFKVDYIYTETTGTSQDPYYGILWTEVTPVIGGDTGSWQGAFRNAIGSSWRNTWAK